MRRSTVFVIGFVSGAWVVAVVGPKVSRTLSQTSVRQVADKAKAVVHLGIERVRQSREEAQILEFPRAVAN